MTIAINFQNLLSTLWCEYKTQNLWSNTVGSQIFKVFTSFKNIDCKWESSVKNSFG